MIKIILLIIIVVGLEILNFLITKKRVGIVALMRDGVTIITIFSIVTLIRYLIKGKEKEFKKDCEKLLKSLEKGIYDTKTHSQIKRIIEIKCGIENTLSVEIKRRNMFFEKLCIGKINKLFKKYRYFRIAFKIT